MCKFLKIQRSLIYYKRKNKRIDNDLEEKIITIFKNSRNNYGSRKIKVELQKIGYQVSLRRIRKFMNLNGLVSNYTIKQYKIHKSTCNNDLVDNVLNREFNREKELDVVVSDLTYVNVAGKWNYICLILDLYNREIVGYARRKGKKYAFEEHLEALIKTLLNNHRWGDGTIVENYDDIKEIFHNYDKEFLKRADPELLYNRLVAINCGNSMLMKQMRALKKNIKTLERIEKDYGSLDNFVLSESPNTIANILYTGKYQLDQVGISFALEYLKKVGIDTCKIDSQVKRILGNERLGLVKNKNATSLQSMKLIKCIAHDSNLTEIEVDSILWQYCISRGANICSDVPKCNCCKLRDICNYNS